MPTGIEAMKPKFEPANIGVEDTTENISAELLYSGLMDYLYGVFNAHLAEGNPDPLAERLRKLGKETMVLSGKLISRTYEIDKTAIGNLIGSTLARGDVLPPVVGLSSTVAGHLAEGIYSAGQHEFAIDLAEVFVTHPEVAAKLPDYLKRQISV
ncbi:hypothetical protein HYS42_01880 [Candidatus Saccharibacteria bacterium]|nr:hypothetical protein [Candidatus Saccharibacteria bacterium]